MSSARTLARADIVAKKCWVSLSLRSSVWAEICARLMATDSVRLWMRLASSLTLHSKKTSNGSSNNSDKVVSTAPMPQLKVGAVWMDA